MRSASLRVALASLLIAVLSGCAWLAPYVPPDPNDDEATVLGVCMYTRAWVPLLPDESVSGVCFVKLEEGEDPFSATGWKASDYQIGNNHYIMGAEPGEYVVVAAYSYVGGTCNVIYLEEEAIEATRTVLRPGVAAFMGEQVLSMHDWSDDVEGAPAHYDSLLSRRFPSYIPMNARWGKTRAVLKESLRDVETEERFLTRSIKSLKNSGWRLPFGARLSELH